MSAPTPMRERVLRGLRVLVEKVLVFTYAYMIGWLIAYAIHSMRAWR